MRLIVLGAGGYGRTVADIARQLGCYTEISFLDDNSEEPDVIGRCVDFKNYVDEETQMYPAFGDNRRRANWIEKLVEEGIPMAKIVHSTAYVSPTSVVESGTVILPYAVVNTECYVERGCIINCGAIIDHGCVLEEGVHVCLGAIVKAENRISRLTKIEAGEIVPNRKYL